MPRLAATIRQAAACTFVPASNDVSDCSKYDRIYSLVKMRMGRTRYLSRLMGKPKSFVSEMNIYCTNGVRGSA